MLTECFVGSRYILPGEDGEAANKRFRGNVTGGPIMAQGEYCSKVVSKFLQYKMPYEIYEGGQSTLARMLTLFAPRPLVSYLLKINLKFDEFTLLLKFAE